MSFQSKLQLDGIEYEILTVDYDVTQIMDHNNRPNGSPKAGLIQVRLKSDNNKAILQWAIDPKMTKSGVIAFYRRDASSPAKKVEFKDAFCVYLKEQFHSEGAVPMITTITISARELVLNDIPIQNPWPGMASGGSSGSQQSNGTIATRSMA